MLPIIDICEFSRERFLPTRANNWLRLPPLLSVAAEHLEDAIGLLDKR
jgi:hypothetical protein